MSEERVPQSYPLFVSFVWVADADVVPQWGRVIAWVSDAVDYEALTPIAALDDRDAVVTLAEAHWALHDTAEKAEAAACSGPFEATRSRVFAHAKWDRVSADAKVKRAAAEAVSTSYIDALEELLASVRADKVGQR